MTFTINILQAIPSYVRSIKSGGPALVAHRLNKALLFDANARVKVLTTNADLSDEVELPAQYDRLEIDEQGISTVYLRRPLGWLPPTYCYTPALSQWLVANLKAYDVVIVHGIWTYFSWNVPRLCRKQGKPYLSFVHGCLDPWAMNHHRAKKMPYWHLIEKRTLQQAAGIVALSQDEADQIRSVGIATPVFIARNGLLFPLPQVDNPKAIVAQSWPELAHAPFVFFMSRLHPKKGLDILLEAWASVVNRFPSWRLTIAGPDEGGYLKTLLQIVKRLSLQNSVIFTDVVSGNLKTALLQCASVFALPSYSEGVPTAVIEALGYGVPVLITPGCHLSEVARAQAGLIVEPRVQTIAAGLERLMSDAVLRRQMEKNAKKLAQTEFDEMDVATKLVDFCRDILPPYKE